MAVYFRVANSANFVNIWSEKRNREASKKFMLYINVLNMKHCWWYIVHFRVVDYSNLKHWGAKGPNLKRHDWQIKCLSMKHSDRFLSQFDFFEQTIDWQQCSNSKSANNISDHVFKFFTGPMMCNSYFLSLLARQNMLRSSASPLCWTSLVLFFHIWWPVSKLILS